MGILQKKYDLDRAEVTFIIIVVLALFVVAFWAWQSGRNKQTSINSFAECVAAGNPVMESYPEQCAVNGQTWTNPEQQPQQNTLSLLSTENWATYSNNNVSFRYPADWQLGNDLVASSADVDIVSADFVEAEELGPSVGAGYWLELYVRTGTQKMYESYDAYLSSVKGIEQGCGGSYEESTVANRPAIISDLKCHGTYRYANFYEGDTEFMLRLNGLDENTDEFRQLFATILSTVALP